MCVWAIKLTMTIVSFRTATEHDKVQILAQTYKKNKKMIRLLREYWVVLFITSAYFLDNLKIRTVSSAL